MNEQIFASGWPVDSFKCHHIKKKKCIWEPHLALEWVDIEERRILLKTDK